MGKLFLAAISILLATQYAFSGEDRVISLRGIRLSYSMDFYLKSPTLIHESDFDVIEIRRRVKSPFPVDNMALCSLGLVRCSEITGQYTVEESGRRVVPGGYTDAVYISKTKGWKLYESYPLCQNPEVGGEINGLAGQCYKSVLNKGERVIVIGGFLGNANSCRPDKICWRRQIIRFRSIQDSVYKKN
ncbi:hypothetical protein [Burkholderia ubonensis]|uniref:hypothetical protein n=1 Tax=Burkholderia ubonensis TaxID=101571 RepID=UPI000F57E038|nr:hypothetical protein [Burkholderia ubonensis]